MRGEILSVGTELLLGDILNTNTQYLSKQLAQLGVNIYYQISVGDNPKRLQEVVKNSLNRSDILIVTGGLGPTKDDITKETISKVLKLPLALNHSWLKEIRRLFKLRNVKMPSNNIKQALLPKGSKVLPNSNGTACGMYINVNDKHIFLLPGPPREMIPMFLEQVVPIISNLSLRIIISKVIKTYGIGESKLVEIIDDLIENQDDPTIATLAKPDGIHIRVTTNSHKNNIYGIVKVIEERLHGFVWGYDDIELNRKIITSMLDLNLTLSLVESCTGGAITSQLTDVPGSSRAIINGSVLYTPYSKAKFLDTSIDNINSEGIDLKLTEHLALASKSKFDTDLSLAITGALGPTAPKGVEIGDLPLEQVYDEVMKLHAVTEARIRNRGLPLEWEYGEVL